MTDQATESRSISDRGFATAARLLLTCRPMLSPPDIALIGIARSLILSRYVPDRHVIGCALRTRSGRIHCGVHLECNVGRIAVCAEAVTIGRAATDGDGYDIDTVVAVYCTSVRTEPSVVAPCGMCREMILDYAPSARVIVPGPTSPRAVQASDLLPGRFDRPREPGLSG